MLGAHLLVRARPLTGTYQPGHANSSVRAALAKPS